MLLTAAGTIGSTLLTPTAPVTGCSTERTESIELVEQTGVWVPLPDDKPIQEQCALNEYVEFYIQERAPDTAVKPTAP